MSFSIEGDQASSFLAFLDHLKYLEKSKKSNLTHLAQNTLKRTVEVSIHTDWQRYDLSVLANKSLFFNSLLANSSINFLSFMDNFFQLNEEKTFFVLNLCEKGFIPIIKNIDEAITIFKITNYFGISYIKKIAQKYLIQNLNPQNCCNVLDGLRSEMDQRLQAFIEKNLDLVVEILTSKSKLSIDYNTFEKALNIQRLLKLFDLEQPLELVEFLCERIEPENFAETVTELFPQEKKLENEIEELLCQNILNDPHFTIFLQQSTNEIPSGLQEMIQFFEIRAPKLKKLAYQTDSNHNYCYLIQRICQMCPNLEYLSVRINGTIPLQDMNKDIEILKICQVLKKQLFRLSVEGFDQRNDQELQNLFSHLIFRRKGPTHFILTSSFNE